MPTRDQLNAERLRQVYQATRDRAGWEDQDSTLEQPELVVRTATEWSFNIPRIRDTSPRPSSPDPPQEHTLDHLDSPEELKKQMQDFGYTTEYINRVLAPGTNRTYKQPTAVTRRRKNIFNTWCDTRQRQGLSNEFPPKDYTYTPDYKVYISNQTSSHLIKKRYTIPDFKEYREPLKFRKMNKEDVKAYKKDGIETYTCHVCKKEHPAIKTNMYNTIHGFYICSYCIQEAGFSKCQKCKKYYYNPEHRMSDENGYNKFYCPDCVEAVTPCKLCGLKRVDKIDFLIKVQDIDNYTDEEYICRDCYNSNFYACIKCSKKIFFNNSFEIPGGGFYCNDCMEKLYNTCNYCGGVFLKCYTTNQLNMNNTDFHPEGFEINNTFACRNCFHRQLAPVKAWNYIPNYEHKTTKADRQTNLRLGIELEIENKTRIHSNEEIAVKIAKLFPFVYCMHDGSLEHGFEITTHPFTYQYFREHVDDFKKLLAYCRSKGFISYEPGTCGIHVHMSKKAFTTCHLYKFIKLFYVRKNFDFIKTISQRDDRSTQDSSQWGKQRELRAEDVESVVKDKAKAKPRYRAKYTAVNTDPPSTIEVRIFRGTLNLNSYIKNIEFCISLYRFSRDNAFKNVTVAKFIKYIRQHKKNYKHLYNFLVDAHWISGKRVKFSKQYARKTKEI